VTYPSAVDRAQGLWDLYGFPVVPNGFFVDEQGILRYAKIGDFDARNPVDVAAIERLLAAPAFRRRRNPVLNTPAPLKRRFTAPRKRLSAILRTWTFV